MSIAGFEKYIRDNNYKLAISYTDNKCPICSSKLYINYLNIKRKSVRTKYKCYKCGFECPTCHIDENRDNIKPIYDLSMKNFILNFGEPKKRINLK